ncbi:MAG: excinuclease ABC subunit UvrA, partial [Myxococcales bacterium]|nr:excinuclease ABC subunit UvrA [Myxococcales bacterium]
MHPIVLCGARTHQLKSVDLELRPGELVALTGVSGAGKSSLAFDTLYSEGQRRFVESFSPYARQYLERLERPPMDSLEPVAAAVAVDRRAPIKSSRSTLATMADLEAYLGAVVARAAVPVCQACGVEAVRLDPVAAAERTARAHPGARAVVSYAVRAASAEELLDVRELLLRDGYRRLLVAGETRDLDAVRPSDVTGGALDVVVDRLTLDARGARRLGAALEEAWGRGAGQATVHVYPPAGDGAPERVPAVRGLACPSCGTAFAPPRPGMFSYESPVGACPGCRGFGRVLGIDWAKVVPDESKTLAGGAIRPWSGPKASWERRTLRKYCERVGIALDVPWAALDAAARARVLEGEGSWRAGKYPGVAAWFRWLETKSYKMHVRVLLSRYRAYDPCPACGGKRLGAEALRYRVSGLDLGDWHALEIAAARARLAALELDGQAALAQRELVTRLAYLERVGLGYLTLDRQARTLSGGEAQRVALTAALGTSLTGVLFALDEPTVGLHPCDIGPLVECTRELAARGNVVLVVEHDERVIEAAHRVVELGPGAGPDGGSIVYDGPPSGRPRHAPRTTSGAEVAFAPRVPRQRRGAVQIVGAHAHNLCDVTVAVPLGCVVAVCGPSGSGKSSLVDDVLYRALARARGFQDVEPAGAHRRIEGASSVRTLTLVDQSPLGRTSRGNAATYTGAWTRLRALFAAQPDALVRGFGPAHFSFNVAAGRCEVCAGEGAETVEMQFLADVRLTCPSCRGQRFKDEVLEVRLDGRNVADFLALGAAEAAELFALDRSVHKALAPLVRLGLGYLPLGQPLSTLSGGEAQRLKLARALGESAAGNLFLLDEPSAGLHPTEVALLQGALDELVAGGGSVVCVDHDLDLIAAADWVIELGPGAGAHGGRVVFEGRPAALLGADTRTAEALRARAALERTRPRSGGPRARRG